MSAKILLVTSIPGFGEVIQETIQQTLNHQVELVPNSLHGLEQIRSYVFDLVILDSDIFDYTLTDFITTVQAIRPGQLIIVIQAEGLPETEWEHKDRHTAFLVKPFYMPDLLDAVASILHPTLQVSSSKEYPLSREGLLGAQNSSTKSYPTTDAQPPSHIEAPAWLEDVNRAAQYLTRLTLETSAQAALIVRSGSVWAYAGQLPQSGAVELAMALNSKWANYNRSDLVRFFHLKETERDYMFYATSLGGDLVLTLVFDVETPFSQMRLQVASLAQALKIPPQEEAVSIAPVISGAQLSDRYPVSGVKDQAGTEPPSLETQATPLSSPKPDMPTLPGQVSELSSLQPAFHGLVHLSYAYLLIPRLPQHHLVGDLSVRLNEWMVNLCLAFGWRLDHLAIRPDFLQWVVSVGPTSSPGFMLKILRRHTSQRIFTEFPRLAGENPSADFWAPSFLILSGSQVHPPQMVDEFIIQVRNQQGIRSVK